ncbi:UNKNOWN [Stylonychia lemnae]|uniref:Uncharacterized protein n=1 Tax=Stylonychia lemnae TaxID=5949 RepID=A0A078AJ46_STYLE|nr:UNKNOWN [Stylonychia lemnae]|eukprot:CDW81497.1 UNKNOWN [Stylonychia lemnae]
MSNGCQESSNQINEIKNSSDQDRDKFILQNIDDPKITTNQGKVKIIQKPATNIDNCSSGSEDLFNDEDSSVLSESSPSQKNNRISCKSKVNFSKLSNDEKVMRLQNMANKIKKLKQQVRSLKNYKSKKALKAKAIFASMQNKTLTPVCQSIISQIPSTQQIEQKYQQENLINQEKFAGPPASFKQNQKQFGSLDTDGMVQTIPNTISAISQHNPANQMLSGLSYQQIQNNMMFVGNSYFRFKTNNNLNMLRLTLIITFLLLTKQINKKLCKFRMIKVFNQLVSKTMSIIYNRLL